MENFDYYPDEDFDFDPILELQNQTSRSSDTTYETFYSPATTRKPSGTQTTLFFSTNSTKNKGKDESGKRCGQEYKNDRSSTGNLIVHLRDKHEIVAQDDTAVSKKV
ncbi:unnamed protein product [Rhizophagus irregularis]|uniref:BED-type domain-containing protein n=1 Tax=Rhizophagus irregularis TaxID=588596 RepID=A0A2N1M6P5_9GLOM|nr:hypothetical protein RhiirC2_798312 [Rhizophagus irregularis]CAB4378103.1 unnamed protein product [Rhizophagus irregularis]